MIVLENGESAEQWYGMHDEYITDEMIEALKHGKRLYIDINHEYAVVIKYRRKNGKLEK